MTVKLVASKLLNDAHCYLEQLSSDDYGKEQNILSGSSIGQHTRHFIEFFQCLLAQIDSEDAVVNYGKRTRNPAIENSVEEATTTIRDIQQKLLNLDANKTCSLDCSDFQETGTYLVASNLERELIYNIEHTIHHLAIIKIGIKSIHPQFELPDHFGIAPSTLNYRRECVQ
jgi:hypothetical protein